jgi:hypothetical protein
LTPKGSPTEDRLFVGSCAFQVSLAFLVRMAGFLFGYVTGIFYERGSKGRLGRGAAKRHHGQGDG